MPEFDITNDATGETITVSGSQAPTPEDAAAIFASRAKAAPLIAPRAPSSIQPIQETPGVLQQTSNVALEAIAGFNRPFAWLADKTVMTPINIIQEMRGKPLISLESMVGERGQFNGEGLITDAAAAAGELSSAFLGGGTVTRTFSSLLDDAAKYGESTVRGVLRQMGRVSPSQDLAMGAGAGIGGEITAEAAEKILGEEYKEEARMIGQLAAPVAISVTLQSILNVGKNIIRSAPTPQELKGAGRALYNTLDQAGLSSADKGKTLSADVTRVMIDEEISSDFYPTVTMVGNNIMRRAKSGNLTFGYLDKAHSLLGRIANTNTVEGVAATKLAEEVSKEIIRLTPSNPAALAGQSVEAVMGQARNFWRRGLVADKIDNIFKSTEMEVLGKKRDYQTVLRGKLTNLLTDKKFTNTLSQENRAAIQDVLKGGNARRTLEAVGSLGANSDDWFKIVMFSGITGGAGYITGSPQAAGGTAAALAAGFAVARASAAVANSLFKQNANLMKAVLKAGPDAKQVMSAYLAATPASQRSAQQMASLMIANNVDLAALQSLPVAKSVLVGDAIYLAGIGQALAAKEAQRKAP
jgi:hypothetical protein